MERQHEDAQDEGIVGPARSRRHFLRALGAALALPTLGGWEGAQSQTVSPPGREQASSPHADSHLGLTDDPLMADVDTLIAESIVIDPVCNLSGFGGQTMAEAITRTGITMIGENARDGPTKGRRRFVEANPDHVMFVRSADDIRTAKRTGKLGFTFHVQRATSPSGASPINGDIANLRRFRDQDILIFLLAYHTNEIGGGDGDDEVGLTRFGVDVVRTMNELGLVIDLSHCSRRTTLQAIELSRAPVTCNHANAEALTPHPRNKCDDEIRALAARDGVIGCVPLRRFAELPRSPSPGIDDFIAHIDYIVDLVGIDHVGLAADGNLAAPALGATRFMGQYLYSYERWKYVALKLMKLGYARQDIQKVLGLNFLRVFEQVWG